MTPEQQNLLEWLLRLSVIFLIASWLYIVIKACVYKFSKLPKRRLGINNIMIFSAGLLASVWCLRYAVGYHSIITSAENNLKWWEEIFNSFVHALQTFSMDEDYTQYITDGKIMVESLYGVGSRAISAYGAYASILNVVAPVAGGAIVFEVIANIFPRVRMFGATFFRWRKIYYFSELNQFSLALAKSIYKNDARKILKRRKLIVFTGVHSDSENETDYEFLMEAKRMNAICLRDDIKHVSKVRKSSYYLMSENEFENLQAFTRLSGRTCKNCLKKSKVYLFVQTDAYVQIEKQVRNRLKHSENGEKPFKATEMPIILPINSYRNLIYNLFTEVPLYEPLLCKKKNKDKLELTIIGNGIIGMEALLGAYWMGQMTTVIDGKMTDVKLKINVLSKEDENEFWSKLDYINPEIERTANEKDKILHAANAVERLPYFEVNYSKVDVKTEGFWNEDDPCILEADYIIVALGNDTDNVDIAEKLRCHIGKAHLEKEEFSPTVISYAVFDPAISILLNGDKGCNNYSKEKHDIYMHAFGGLHQVYSCDNIFMSQNTVIAKEIGEAYTNVAVDIDYVKTNEKRAESENENYKYWANISRALHIKYKVFSLGWIKSSVFDSEDNANGVVDITKHNNEVSDLCAKYRRVSSIRNFENFDAEELLAREDVERRKHILAWLEHRRWCAFTRTMGYQTTDAIKRNVELSNGRPDYKNMLLKLHPCLVEAVRPQNDNDVYISASFLPDGRVDEATAFMGEPLDMLDRVSYKCREFLGKDAYNFKMYDYYSHEFEHLFFKADIQKLNMPKKVSNKFKRFYKKQVEKLYKELLEKYKQSFFKEFSKELSYKCAEKLSDKLSKKLAKSQKKSLNVPISLSEVMDVLYSCGFGKGRKEDLKEKATEGKDYILFDGKCFVKGLIKKKEKANKKEEKRNKKEKSKEEKFKKKQKKEMIRRKCNEQS